MLTELEWNGIVQNIKNEKSVLIIGTDALIDAQNRPLLPQFLELEIIGYPNNPQIRFFDGDFLFFKDNKSSKGTILSEWQDFLEKQKPTPFLETLAQIPFHLILCLNPDLRLRKTFEEQSFDLVFDFYQKNKKPADLAEKPTKEKPLLYNLMGKIGETNSLVFTQEDTFDYLISILGNEFRLADRLKKELLDAENIIFLGVPLEKWYMKMLSRLFEIREEGMRMALGKEGEIDKNTQIFCENRDITLVQIDMNDFVSQLSQKWTSKGYALRQKMAQGAENELDQIAKLVKTDVGACLEALVDYLENKDDELYNSAMLQLGKHNKLQKDIGKGTIDSRDQAVAEAKILDATLNILKEAKQL